ncbi:hypothetical protein Pan97_49130 [Bremerella volcania]|uniref:Lipoprotein n=1 Tax=Bremerella volcania TaxID=2527984 RepID=A0A518CF86_9BACT|nr:hypothetical protein [Bremerella volcania]QDU77834.1 hypothetical protein Pan97_49130 [Bremerella volcania]
MLRRACLSLVVALLLSPSLFAQDDKASDVQAKRYALFEKRLDNVALVGSFTISGKEDQAPKPERYEIKNVRKLEEGDIWLINARIKYGDKDVQLPLPLEVKWAGMTPVISLDKTTIPGMGTFSAHVVIDEDKYAGTWTHGEVGGALFGRIEKLGDEVEAPKDQAQSSPE